VLGKGEGRREGREVVGSSDLSNKN